MSADSSLIREGYTRWSDQAPPWNVPLIIYCDVNHWKYRRTFLAQEVVSKNWDPELPQDFRRIYWKLTGIAREILEGRKDGHTPTI